LSKMALMIAAFVEVAVISHGSSPFHRIV
jgi:hypothetical protein